MARHLGVCEVTSALGRVVTSMWIGREAQTWSENQCIYAGLPLNKFGGRSRLLITHRQRRRRRGGVLRRRSCLQRGYRQGVDHPESVNGTVVDRELDLQGPRRKEAREP